MRDRKHPAHRSPVVTLTHHVSRITSTGVIMQRRLSFIRLLSLILVLASVFNQAWSQTRTLDGNLRVRAIDPLGAALDRARVRVVSAEGREEASETNQKGEAFFQKLAPGRYKIMAEADGFEPVQVSDVTVKAGNNQFEIRLEVAHVKEEMAVSRDNREKQTDPNGNAFSTILTEDDIANLPDDPEELSAALRDMAGPGAGPRDPTIRINGFRGGKLPPKSQIREIRFRMNPYSAENHDADLVSIDVFTKPGVDLWHGNMNFAFRDESFNARNPFAPFRGPEQNRRYGFDLGGPLWRNHTSLFVNVEGTSLYDSQTIVAALPEGNFSDLIRRPSRSLDGSARVEHALTKTHNLMVEYQRNARLQENLGVGDFDLADRAYSTDVVENIFRLSDSGLLSKRMINDFRFQARWQSLDSHSATSAPAILVLDAFNRGGAQIENRRRTRELELADNVNFASGKHSMKAGALLEAAGYTSRDLQNTGGTFTFASLEDFRLGRPTTFTERAGEADVSYSQYQFGWFFQDDWKLTKGLTLSLGLRHEVQNHLGDRNNFSPRIGVAWSPFKNGQTTFRAGAGVFYDWFAAETFEQTLRVDGKRQQEIVVRNPGFPDPFGGGDSITLPPGRIMSAPDLKLPAVEQASFMVERRLTKTLMLRSGYTYQSGVNLLRGHNINAPIPGLGRPDPTAGNIIQIESTARSTLHMFNVGVSRLTRGFHFNLNYSLSKATNEADSPLALPADNFDLRAERGPAPWDARHRLFGLVTANLIKGFRLGATFTARSATPYDITTGFDDNGDSVSNDRPEGVTRNSARGSARWDMGARLSWGFGFGKRPDTGARGGRPKMIRIRDGDDALGMVSGDPQAVDKRWRMDFYIQANNLFNHTNLMNFTGVETSPFFGQAIAAAPGRRIETGMKFSF